MKVYEFCLANRVFRLEHCQKIRVNSAFIPFLVCNQKPDCVVSFLENENLHFYKGRQVFSDISLEILQTEEGFVRQYWEAKENCRPYAVNRIGQDRKTVNIEYLPEFRKAFDEARNSFSHIGLEELLLYQQRMILHASFVEHEGEGILFSGPSGIGKSTQADLWKEKEGAEIINGDRPILGVKDGAWTAWGSPYAGSSGYHIQRSAPIKAIVMLAQGSENHVQRLNVRQAVSAILAQTTMNSWNPQNVERTVDLVMQLAAAVPVFRLQCTPNEKAVEVLKEYL